VLHHCPILINRRCQHRSRNDRAHLILRNLQEFDISYLTALISGDSMTIKQHEELAKYRGYGPLVPCTFVASPSEQKQICRMYYYLPNFPAMV